MATATADKPRFNTSAYDKLVAKGCKCGTERPQDCKLHGPKDNRGLRAFYTAGLPLAFPSAATCGACGADGLAYPNIDIDDPKGSGEYKPTLVCPNCSNALSEWRLRREAEDFGYVLNDRLVFAGGSTYSPGVRQMEQYVAELDDLDRRNLEVAWHATPNGSNCTADFYADADGQILYGNKKPSYALALLFDFESFMRTNGEKACFEWEAPTPPGVAA